MTSRSDRLYDYFHHERAVFHRWVAVTVSLCLFYGLVFHPYLTTLARLDALDRQLTADAEEITRTQQEVDDMRAAIERATGLMGDASAFVALYERTQSWVGDLEGIEQLYDRQSRRVARLRDALSEPELADWPLGRTPPSRTVRILQDARPQLMASYDPADTCFFRLEEDWVRCHIDRQLEPIRTRMSQVLYDRSTSHEYTQRLEAAVDANQERYEAGLDAAIRDARIAAWLEDYLEEERAIVRRWYEEMARERQDLEQRAREQQELMAENEGQRRELEARKEEISAAGTADTPVGALPVSFHDFIELLPLAMLVAGCLLLAAQHRLLVLRNRFRRYGDRDETDPETLVLTLPLWLDPLKRTSWNVAAALALLVPAVAASVGTAQLRAGGAASLPAAPAFVLPLTVAAAVVFAIAYARTIAAWQSARREVRPASPSPPARLERPVDTSDRQPS